MLSELCCLLPCNQVTSSVLVNMVAPYNQAQRTPHFNPKLHMFSSMGTKKNAFNGIYVLQCLKKKLNKINYVGLKLLLPLGLYNELATFFKSIKNQIHNLIYI